MRSSRPSIVKAGLDPDNMPQAQSVDVARDIDVNSAHSPFKRWKDIWSAGHSVSGVTQIGTVAELVAQTLAQYQMARMR